MHSRQYNNYYWSCIIFIDLPVLTRSGTKFMGIYPETVTQKDQAIQADMFLAVSSPKQSSPVPTPGVTISFGDDDTM